jgi:putative ATP-binding cassette transporter
VQVLTLFGRELGGGKWRSFLILAAVSGISSAAVLATINLSAGNIDDADVMAHALIVLVLAIVLFVYSQKTLMVQAAELAQRTVHHLRLGLLETLQAAELLEVENLNRSEIFSTVSTEMRVISDGASTMMVVAQSAVLTVVTMAYLAWLSLVAFLIAAIFIGIAASIHISRHRQIMDQHARMFTLNTEMMDGFADFVDGFKELKLNTARAQELGNRVSAQSAAVSARSLDFQSLFATSFVASQVTFFLLTGIMVFIVPLFTTIDPQTLVKITATTLFLIGPISTVVGGLPTVQRLNAAADLILSLQRRLSEIQHWSPPGTAEIKKFDRIELSDVTFSYASTDEDEAGFTVGPISMPIEQGKVIFVTGGNGSGKSTLLKLVTSLYLPTAGKLTLDGRTLGDDDIVPFRNLFSAIFSDNHLFKELYGIPEIDPAKVTEYLKLLELEHKVSVKGRSFSTVALSSGQRKRLALLVALLENRPIYVFDEWAADQDPYFRQKFYQTILPSLKASGKTVFAVTHDERYFDTADVRFHMVEGQLRQVTGSSPSGED